MNDQHNQNPPSDNNGGTDIDSVWESAMSRDFDARVRDLHEAPLSLDSVKGKAVTIRRNRRIAVAGGVLAVAAVITPVAVLASSNGGDTDSRPPVATQDAEDPTTVSEPDYIVDGVWHQADGDDVALPENDYYSAATIWGGQLAAQRAEGDDVSNSVTDIIDADGNVVDTFDSNQGVAVSDDRSVLAYISRDGDLITRWADGQVAMGTGFAAGDTVVSVSGGPECEPDNGSCTVVVNQGIGGCLDRGSTDSVVGAINSPDGPVKCFDQDGTTYSVRTEVKPNLDTCGGLFDAEALEFRWTTCDFQPQQISPDGQYVAAPPSQYDGLGPTSISILDAENGDETGRYGVEGGSVGTWAWREDGRLLFTAYNYDGASWHLFALTPNNEVEELTDPVPGNDTDSPFTLVQH